MKIEWRWTKEKSKGKHIKAKRRRETKTREMVWIGLSIRVTCAEYPRPLSVHSTLCSVAHLTYWSPSQSPAREYHLFGCPLKDRTSEYYLFPRKPITSLLTLTPSPPPRMCSRRLPPRSIVYHRTLDLHIRCTTSRLKPYGAYHPHRPLHPLCPGTIHDACNRAYTTCSPTPFPQGPTSSTSPHTPPPHPRLFYHQTWNRFPSHQTLYLLSIRRNATTLLTDVPHKLPPKIGVDASSSKSVYFHIASRTDWLIIFAVCINPPHVCSIHTSTVRAYLLLSSPPF